MRSSGRPMGAQTSNQGHGLRNHNHSRGGKRSSILTAQELGFNVIKLRALIEEKSLKISEPAAYLKYETPRFRAAAMVMVPPLERGEVWEVGWVQAVRNIKFINEYGSEGHSSWEIPELIHNIQPLVCDNDGAQYPWYGNTPRELVRIRGPTHQPTVVKIGMEDQFAPRVSWCVPDRNRKSQQPTLTKVFRRQSFYTWLVARDCTRDIFHPLKSMSWAVQLHIAVDPNAPVGRRATLLEKDIKFPQPVIYSNLIPLHESALRPPRANCAQQLVWVPSNGPPKVVIAPLNESLVPEEEVLNDQNLRGQG